MGASGNPNATRLSALSERKKALEDSLQKRNLELRQLCIKEAELTGVIPIEYPLEPGEKPPVFQKTGFQISQNLLNNLNNGEEAVSEVELELQVLAKMADAAQGLSNDHNIGKTVRRHHRSEYEAIKKRYEALLEKIQFSGDSYSVAARQTASTSNKGFNSQHKQKKKPRPLAGEHVDSQNTAAHIANPIGPLAIATDSASSSSFSKESPHRRSSRSLASEKSARDSVPNLVSAQLQRAESSDANVGGGRNHAADVDVSSTPIGANGDGHLLRASRSHTVEDVALGYVSPSHPDVVYNAAHTPTNYADDMSRRFAHINMGIQSNGGKRTAYPIHNAPRMVYEENQRQLDSLLFRQQAIAQAQTLERRADSGVAHARPEHHSMYNISSLFPRQQQQLYDDGGIITSPQIQHHIQQMHPPPAVRLHSALVYRPSHLHHQQQMQHHQQLQPHQLYGDQQQQQQQVLMQQQQQQQQQRLYWHTGAESPQQQQFDLSPSALADNSSPSIPTTPLRYGSLDRRQERPQRTLQANAQAQSHDVQRRKKSIQSKVGNRCAASSNKNSGINVDQHLHQQLQRTQSLGSVGVIQQQQQEHTNHVDHPIMDDVDLDIDRELDNTAGDDDNQSSCGSEQSTKYRQMRRRRRSKEKNWYESSLDVPQISADNSDRSSNMTHSSTHSVIAPEDKYGDVSVSVQFRQRAATLAAGNASVALTSPTVVRPLSTAVQQFNVRPGLERLIIHRPPPKQTQQQLNNTVSTLEYPQQVVQYQQPPIRPRAQAQQLQMMQQTTQQLPPPPPPLPPAHNLMEIPAESRPSPSVIERVQNHTMFTSPIAKAGTTVLQVGQCKPYQEETKPFEMSDYYKYSTKHNKTSPAKQQPSVLSPSISSIATLSPHLEFQHPSPNSVANYVPSMISAQRAIHFSPTSPSKAQQATSSSRIGAVPVPNSPRRSINISFDISPVQNIAENFATEMNQWYNNNNSNNNINNNLIVSDAGAGMNGKPSPRKGNATTTATLV